MKGAADRLSSGSCVVQGQKQVGLCDDLEEAHLHAIAGKHLHARSNSSGLRQMRQTVRMNERLTQNLEALPKMTGWYVHGL